jgi:hypothetical protein
MIIRSYHPDDEAEIQRIHEENKLDFAFPNLNSSLFTVNKVLLIEGKLRASYALRMVAEVNLWLDKSNWTDAEGKWLTVKALDKEAMDAARDVGIDGVQCFLPPGYERFGKRICGKDGLGFTEDRPNWRGYGKFLVGAQQ